MSRTIFDHSLQLPQYLTGVVRVLLLTQASTYVPVRSHQYLSDLWSGGGVEVSDPASYARQTLASKTAAADTVKHQFELDADDIAFGNLEMSAERVKAAVYYIEVGGDDSTPGDDLLWIYDDGKIDLTLSAPAGLTDTTIYIDDLKAPIRGGTDLDFGGGATCTVAGTSDIAKGATQLTVSGMAAAAANRASSTDVDTTAIIPGLDCLAVLANGPVNIQFDPDGLVYFKQR